MMFNKNLHIWIGHYLMQRLLPPLVARDRPIDIMFCVADHFEPIWLTPD